MKKTFLYFIFITISICVFSQKTIIYDLEDKTICKLYLTSHKGLAGYSKNSIDMINEKTMEQWKIDDSICFIYKIQPHSPLFLIEYMIILDPKGLIKTSKSNVKLVLEECDYTVSGWIRSEESFRYHNTTFCFEQKMLVAKVYKLLKIE